MSIQCPLVISEDDTAAIELWNLLVSQIKEIAQSPVFDPLELDLHWTVPKLES